MDSCLMALSGEQGSMRHVEIDGDLNVDDSDKVKEEQTYEGGSGWAEW